MQLLLLMHSLCLWCSPARCWLVAEAPGEGAHILLVVCSDEHVELLILAIVVLGVPGSTLLDTATTADGDLGVGLFLHALLGVAARPNDQADEVVARVLLLGNEDLAVLLGRPPVWWGPA